MSRTTDFFVPKSLLGSVPKRKNLYKVISDLVVKQHALAKENLTMALIFVNQIKSKAYVPLIQNYRFTMMFATLHV